MTLIVSCPLCGVAYVEPDLGASGHVCSTSGKPRPKTPPFDVPTGDPGWLAVHRELPALHVEKSSTYGTDAEPLNNFVQLGLGQSKPAERYVWERIIEKSLRALQMIDADGADDVEEGPDVASLAIIAEALRRRRAA